MRSFHEVVDFCSFQDLGWIGVPFTWDNKQHGRANVKARLDRVLGNGDFLSLYAYTFVKHISSTASDHCYVLAELRTVQARGGQRGPRQFRYKNVWQTQ